MSLANDIRNYLALHKRRDGTYRGRLLSEIARGIGYPADPAKAERFHLDIGYSLAQQIRAGCLSADKKSAKRFLYSFVKHPPVRILLTPEARRERKNQRERVRLRVRNKEHGRTLAQYRIERREQAIRNAPIRAANQKARQLRMNELKRAQRAAARAARPPVVKVTPAAKAAAAAAKRAALAAAAARLAEMRGVPVKAPPRVESVDEWMERTGEKPMRLGLGVVSKPLRTITPHEQNQASWQKRQRRLKEAA